MGGGEGEVRALSCLGAPVPEQSGCLSLPFCTPQAVQRRLNEIEASLRELEAEGVQLELALRSQGSECRFRGEGKAGMALCLWQGSVLGHPLSHQAMGPSHPALTLVISGAFLSVLSSLGLTPTPSDLGQRCPNHCLPSFLLRHPRTAKETMVGAAATARSEEKQPSG